MMDTGIADRLRQAGLEVVECAGWQTRGSSSFDPRGSVDHHTAGPASGDAPSLNTVIHGRPDLAGPLCHVLIGRHHNTCYVIAAGHANHAGSGGWHGLSGNSSVYGIERENVGTQAEPWRPDQTDAAARAHAALIRGRTDAGMVCRHAEWAPNRKPDTHDLSGDLLRDLVADYLAGGPKPAEQLPTGAVTMFVAIDSVGFYALAGHVLYTFRDMAAYGASKNASPNVPALVIGAETPRQDRDEFLANLVRQHATATTG
jgi:N-acetylmuramoyl-L-alanine amidase